MNYLNGGPWRLVDEFTEVESGKRNVCPELQKALAACRKHKAKLVIAKLDRLSRNLAFNRLTVHILAALAAAKRRGVKLGGPRLAAARKASIALLSPEIPKPIRGQLGVTHRVQDVFVAEPGLQRPGVMAWQGLHQMRVA